jgi:hypothetical protein
MPNPKRLIPIKPQSLQIHENPQSKYVFHQNSKDKEGKPFPYACGSHQLTFSLLFSS